MKSTHEELEHIEHTKHAAHDPFDRNVALTMAIVAAILACVTMLSHRAHNETLRLLGEATDVRAHAGILATEIDTLKTEANSSITLASDQWNYYQAKNLRKYQYEAFVAMLAVMAKDATPDSVEKVRKGWADNIAKWESDLKKHMADARKHESDAHAKLEEAKRCMEETEKMPEEVQEKIRESEHAHHRGTGFDISELAVELALVLCAISVLTKNPRFWLVGMVCCVVGVSIAGYTYFILH